jgi:hypothetical protein
VENDSLKKECVDLETSKAFFLSYGLDTAEVTELGVYDNFRQLNIRLLRYYDEISRGRIEVHHEGAVLYFESQVDLSKKGFEEKRVHNHIVALGLITSQTQDPRVPHLQEAQGEA